MYAIFTACCCDGISRKLTGNGYGYALSSASKRGSAAAAPAAGDPAAGTPAGDALDTVAVTGPGDRDCAHAMAHQSPETRTWRRTCMAATLAQPRPLGASG